MLFVQLYKLNQLEWADKHTSTLRFVFASFVTSNNGQR